MRTSFGTLPVPVTVQELQARAVRMPDVIDGFGRLSGPAEQMRWARDGAELGIDVTEISDIAPDVSTAAQALAFLKRQLKDARECAPSPALCLTGTRPEGVTVVWGDVGSPLMLAATAVDEEQLRAVLAQWSR